MSVSRHGLTAAVSLVAGILIGQSLGAGAGAQTPAPAGAASTEPRPAFLVASSRPIAPDKMGPYRQAAGPLALKAGMQILAAGDPSLHVLEGTWPHKGNLTIERYRSMDDLLAFWNSSGYQSAKKLREGLVDMNFIVAVEGR